MQIFSWIGNVFGYLLWFFYEFTKNYGVSIILFTIVLKIIMFPFSIKQQKSMAKNTRLQGKQKEIQKKYGDNKQKMSEEMQKLYQQEGVNPMGGCLTSIIPLIIMMGIYYSVVNPLQNTLHIAGSKEMCIRDRVNPAFRSSFLPFCSREKSLSRYPASSPPSLSRPLS